MALTIGQTISLVNPLPSRVPCIALNLGQRETPPPSSLSLNATRRDPGWKGEDFYQSIKKDGRGEGRGSLFCFLFCLRWITGGRGRQIKCASWFSLSFFAKKGGKTFFFFFGLPSSPSILLWGWKGVLDFFFGGKKFSRGKRGTMVNIGLGKK